MTMSIIKPNGMNDAKLSSSTVPEADYPAWNSATNYTVGTSVTRAVSGVHRNFENLIAGVDATLPELAPTRWLDIGPTNRWSMFDEKVGTVTTATGGLTVVMRPGAVSGIALLELTGKQVDVVMKDAPGGVVVYSKSIVLDGTFISSFYDWFYTEYQQLTDVVLTGLPSHFVSNELTLTITGATEDAAVGCGVCHFGEIYDIGETLQGATVGVISYSVKRADAFGNVAVVKRANSKRSDLKVMTEKSAFNMIYRRLASLDSVPCVYIGTEAQGYEPLIVYGFYKDFSIDVAYNKYHLCNLSIEGLI